MTERLMLLDTASLYFRAFYGIPDSVRGPDGTPVNAVRGLLDIIARLVTDFEPTSLVACWDDAWRPRWRVELIPSYKAQR
ncbi:MAG TPA: flap endonuclease, partial [Microbacteriaceae bacterium]|nr:flap endonuclease [Microbacteriaceae bacterium]